MSSLRSRCVSTLLALGLACFAGCSAGDFGLGRPTTPTTPMQPVPGATISPASLSFAGLTGTSSAVQNATLTNSGTASLTINSISLSGAGASAFSLANTCPGTLAAGASCTVGVTYSPVTAGPSTATLSVNDNAANSPQTVALSGSATLATPAVSLSVSTLNFAQVVGGTSPVQTATVTNTGNATLNIGGIMLGGANPSVYNQTTTCGATLAPAATCAVSVSFSPTVAGSLPAEADLMDDAANSPQQLFLTGTGMASAVTLSSGSLNFTQPAGASSAPQSITLTNSGTASLTSVAVSVTGANASAFAQGNNCPATLTAGAACTINVTFTPAAANSYAAVLNIMDNATNSPQTASLTGTGTAPAVALSSTSLSFTQNAGTTSSPQAVSLTNSGSAPLTIMSISVTGTNAASFAQTNNCGTTLAAGANCNLAITFSPATAGPYSAAVNIADNANGPQSISLSGTGKAVNNTAPAITLTPAVLSFTALAETTTTPQTVTLTNSGTATLNLTSLTLTGTNAVAYTQTNNCGASVAPLASCTLTFTFTPSIAASFSAALAITSNAPAASLPLNGTGTGLLTINTSVSTDWKISNGAINLDFNPNTGNIFSVHLVGFPDELVDVYTTSAGQPRGLYSGNVGDGAGPVTFGYTQNGNTFIDFWSRIGSSSTNFASEAQHYIITANDTGFHGYYVLDHSATDIAGSLGQQQYIFRVNTSLFDTMYLNDSGLQNLGPVSVQLPTTTVTGSTDPGRQVQNACVDISGLAVPPSWTRKFATKYDFSSYEYLHKAHGLYGTKYGSWAVFPSQENMIGGPSKQDLIFTENIVIVESLSSHYILNIGWTQPQGTAATKLFGPAYFHFNAVSAALPTPAAMFAESQRFVPAFNFLYDNEPLLLSLGHIASSARGTVAPTINNGGSPTTNTAWTTLGDNTTNYQQTTYGRQYFVNNNATGTTPLTGVVPGNYRLSHYVLGQWGEIRADNIAVTANQTTKVPLNFTPENFGPAAPVWTIGTPDRSAHEFLHGHDAAGNDLRNYQGSYNYWADFAANKGTQVFYATAVGSTPQTTDLTQLNYVQWGLFNPGLFAGIYNASDDTTDGYKYIVPAYVGDPSTVKVPPTTIHFTTTAAQQAQGRYATLSVGIASAEASVIATLNGHQLIYHYVNASDAMVRSGLSGFYQWGALQFDTTSLSAPGQDNILTLSVSQNSGVMLDALRLEITPNTADPAVTGWNDYGYAYGSTYKYQNDALPNNGK